MKKDFSICSKLERENFWFFLEANPVGCQNKYLLVPKGLSSQLFSIGKKLIVLKFGNWARRNLAVSSIFFCGFDKAGFHLSGRTIWEEFSSKKKIFPSTYLDREQKKCGFLDKFSHRDVKMLFYVSTRTVWRNFLLKFCIIFNLFSPLSQNFVEQSR